MTQSRHAPVLLADVLSALRPRDGGVYVDGTFGGGGYSRALLEAADCRVFGIDRDPDAIGRADAMRAAYGARLTLIHGTYGDMTAHLAPHGVDAADGVTLDVGVSSDQIDTPERGFSFQADGPLDMRMSGQGLSAADVVNGFDEEIIAGILWRFGEERRSRQIAKAIVQARAEQPFERTRELAGLCARVLGRHQDGIHPATRTFQALRIYVNDELGELARGLAAAETLLRPAGRLAVVSFHSLEDRIVKQFLAARSGRAGNPSRHAPPAERPAPSFTLLSRGATEAGPAEVAANPRARSARLRAAERTAAAAHPPEQDFRRLTGEDGS